MSAAPHNAPRAPQPHVRLRLPDDSVTDLLAGDLIGRAPDAALQLDDARVSEAHAMVSLRGGTLRLLGLRGRFAVEGKVLSDVELTAGVRVWLTPELPLEVVQVVLPDGVLALEGDGLPRQVLHGVCSLVFDPHPALVRGVHGGAPALLWRTGSRWRLRVGDGDAVDLHEGHRFTVHGHAFQAVTAPIGQAAGQSTLLEGGLRPPLRVVTHYDTVQIHRDQEEVLVLGGVGARIISELVACEGPLSWRAVCREIWGQDDDEHRQRQRLDAALVRLRRKLEAARLPRDLLVADGSGQLALLLRDGDRVEDGA